MRLLSILICFWMFTLLFSACKSADFSSSAPRKAQPSENATPEYGDDDNDPREEVEKHRPTDMSSQVDIIFLFDTSGSMDKLVRSTIAQIADFVSRINSEYSSLDYQLLLVGKGLSSPVSSDRISTASTSIGSHNALNIAKDILTSGQSYGSVRLRKQSTKQLVVVSNEDSSESASKFSSWVENNRSKVGRIHVNGFVSFRSNPLWFTSPCPDRTRGDVYITLSEQEKTKGLVQDICSADWNALFTKLQKQVVQSTSSSVELRGTPSNPDGITVRVNGSKIDSDDFDYDRDSNTLTIGRELNPTDEIEIRYER